MLGNLPPKYRSQLRNIQLAIIVKCRLIKKYNIIKKYSMDAILKPLIDDILKLVRIVSILIQYTFFNQFF